MVEPRPEPDPSGSANVVPIRQGARAREQGRTGEEQAVLADERLIEDVRAGLVSPSDPDPMAAFLAFWRRLAWDPRAVDDVPRLPCPRRRTG
ncbi:MAG TPA: hypothetical protein VGO23_13110 [Pseudonocardia sp.]|jgi:hypothetical protein|nr:hypothetical protein [Pseudonocardia sp.]